AASLKPTLCAVYKGTSRPLSGGKVEIGVSIRQAGGVTPERATHVGRRVRRQRNRSSEIEERLRASGFKSPLASTNCRKRKRMGTATEVKFAPASSTCSQLSRPRWAAGSDARSASCERARRLACRTWLTTFAAQ